MANVQKIIRTNAILTYLSAQQNASLGDIASHFDMPWANVLSLLWDANMVEVTGMPIPFDLDLPDRDVATPESIVHLQDTGSGQIPPLPLGLDEAMVLVALIDQVLEVTPVGVSREALRDLRTRISDAAAGAGFGAAIWSEPEPPISSMALATITQAIAEHRYVQIAYHRQGSDLHERISNPTVIPLALSTGTAPTLRAAKDTDDGLGRRTYRLDRIGSAALATSVPAKLWREANALPAKDWVPTGQTVTLYLTRGARWAAETLPGAVTMEVEGMLVMSLPISSEEWLFSLLVQLGDTVVAVDPPDVSDRMAARAAHLLKENT